MSGITDPAQKYFKDGLWTFDGTVWRPQNQLYAYRTVWREAWYDLNAAAGTNTHNFGTVPAGEVWVLEGLHLRNVVTAASFCSVALIGVGATVNIGYTAYATVTRELLIHCSITLAPTEYVQAGFLSCALNDDILADVWGHKFKIAE
jgi:hypothetical protein